MPYTDKTMRNRANQRYELRMKTQPRHCVGCSQIFWINPHRKKSIGQDFCSRACLYASGVLGVNLLKYAKQPKTREHAEKIKRAQIGLKSGPKNPRWKGGITSDVHRFYNRNEWRDWKKGVLKTGGYLCSTCGSKERLHCHHVHEAWRFPEIAFYPENGIVMCATCHWQWHGNNRRRDTSAPRIEQSGGTHALNSVNPLHGRGNTEPSPEVREGVETVQGVPHVGKDTVQTANADSGSESYGGTGRTPGCCMSGTFKRSIGVSD